MRMPGQLEALAQDVRYCLRLLARTPGFTATVLVSLAFGIGSCVAVFTIVETLLLRPLPVRSPNELYALSQPGRGLDVDPSYYSHGFYEQLRGSSPLFDGLAASSTAVSSGVNLAVGGVTARVGGELVSGNYFEVLGVDAAVGRVLTRDDDRTPGAHQVLVMSHAFWQRRFAGAPDLVGRTVSINGVPFTVAGIARQGFFGIRPGFAPDIWVPLMMVQTLTAGGIEPGRRDQNYLELIVRLESGTSVQQAEATATTVYRHWLEEDADPNRRQTSARPVLHLSPAGAGHSALRGQYGQPLLILMAAVILLLLVACANVATLLLARAATRVGEIAIRVAIGAPRARLVRQLITEGLLIGLIGGALGGIVSVCFGGILLTYLPADAERWQFSPNLQVFLFALIVSLGSGLLSGLVPVLRIARENAALNRRDAGRPRVVRRMLEPLNALTVVQVALSVLLLIGAGLLARTLQNLRAADMGFARGNVLLVSLDPARSGYTSARIAAFFDQLLEQVRERHEIQAVGLASHGSLSGVLPVGTRFISTHMHAAGSARDAGEDLTGYNNFVSPGYFGAAGIPLLGGRDFSEADRRADVEVAIVNQAAARLLFGGDDPIGRRIGRGSGGPATIEVVGLVQDAKYLNVREPPRPIVYLPFRDGSPMTLHVRTPSDPRSALRVVEEALNALDPMLPLFHVQTIGGRIDDSLRQERLMTTLAAVVSLIGTLLSAAGLHGVISFSVAQRRRDIGIRMALGAEPRQVLLMVVGRGMLLVAAGVAVGLPAAMASLRAVASVLYGVSPADPVIAFGAIVFVAVAGLVATVVPARVAARTQPQEVLRNV